MRRTDFPQTSLAVFLGRLLSLSPSCRSHVMPCDAISCHPVDPSSSPYHLEIGHLAPQSLKVRHSQPTAEHGQRFQLDQPWKCRQHGRRTHGHNQSHTSRRKPSNIVKPELGYRDDGGAVSSYQYVLLNTMYRKTEKSRKIRLLLYIYKNQNQISTPWTLHERYFQAFRMKMRFYEGNTVRKKKEKRKRKMFFKGRLYWFFERTRDTSILWTDVPGSQNCKALLRRSQKK